MNTPTRCTVPVAMATLAVALVVKPVETPAGAVLDTALVLMAMGIIRIVAAHVAPPGPSTRRWGFAEFLHGSTWATAISGTAAVWKGHLDGGDRSRPAPTDSPARASEVMRGRAPRRPRRRWVPDEIRTWRKSADAADGTGDPGAGEEEW